MKKRPTVEDYKPIAGFFDLRKWKLPKRVFMKLWNIQKQLAHMNKRAEYFQKHEQVQWQKAQELSGQYQQILFSYGRA